MDRKQQQTSTNRGGQATSQNNPYQLLDTDDDGFEYEPTGQRQTGRATGGALARALAKTRGNK